MTWWYTTFMKYGWVAVALAACMGTPQPETPAKPIEPTPITEPEPPEAPLPAKMVEQNKNLEQAIMTVTVNFDAVAAIGSLTKTATVKALHRQGSKIFRGCHVLRKAAKTHIVLDFTIGGDGKISDAIRATSSDIGYAKCVQEFLPSAEFGASTDKGTTQVHVAVDTEG